MHRLIGKSNAPHLVSDFIRTQVQANAVPAILFINVIGIGNNRDARSRVGFCPGFTIVEVQSHGKLDLVLSDIMTLPPWTCAERAGSSDMQDDIEDMIIGNIGFSACPVNILLGNIKTGHPGTGTTD